MWKNDSGFREKRSSISVWSKDESEMLEESRGGTERFFYSFGQVRSSDLLNRGVLVTENNVTRVM